MILDSLLCFSGAVSPSGSPTGQSVTGTGNVLSTNVIDLANSKDWDAGQPIDVAIQALVDTVGGTSIEIQVVAADDAGLTTNLTVIGSSGPIPVAMLTAGARRSLQAKSYTSRGTSRRYLGLRYVLLGSVTTSSFLAAVVGNADSGRPGAFKNGFGIL